jgi:hypothetical protein
MKIICYVTQETIAKRCPVRSCMWYSVSNKTGCMAHPVPPDPENLNEKVLAKHKGVKAFQIAQWRAQGNARIEAAIVLHQFFDWHKYKQKEALPWDDKTVDSGVTKAVNKLCTQQWPYTIGELEWTPGKVSATVDADTVRRFLVHTGKQIDWLKTLGLSAQQQSSIAQIFKRKKVENGNYENTRCDSSAADRSGSSKSKRAR